MAAITGSTLATISAAMSAVSGVAQIVGGMQQQAEAKNQANYALAQSEMQAAETARTTALQASAEKRDAEATRKAQKLAYMKSGVSLEGTPFLMLEKTRLRGNKNVEEILQAGAYGAAGQKLEGRLMADQYKSSGRRAFVSGLTEGVKGLGNAALTYSQRNG